MKHQIVNLSQYFVILAAFMLLAVQGVYGQTVAIDPATIESPAAGEQFTLNINITGGTNVAGYQLTVTFDPTALSYVSIANGDYLPAGAFATPPNLTDNQVIFGAASLTGSVEGDGTLATVTFTVVEAKNSEIGLEAVVSDPTATAIDVTVEGGMVTLPPAQKPDLVVGQPTVSPTTLAPGERFTLSATVKNQGAGRAAATTLRYYRSTNTTISTRDTEVGKDSVSALGSNQSSAESISLTAPSSPGTYYYGACVEAVTGESSSNNNCSAAVSITVQRAPIVSTPSQPFIYWTDVGADKIQRANLDGSNVQNLVTKDLDLSFDIALDVSNDKMYWTEASDGAHAIKRANLNGGNVETLISGGGAPTGIALDVANGKMYWINNGFDKIQRANLDGSNVETLITGLDDPVYIALDLSNDKMYWTEAGSNPNIQRANLDGSNAETLVAVGTPFGIALDVSDSKMYWIDNKTDSIQRANLNGRNVETLVSSLGTPLDIALDIANSKMYWVDNTGSIKRASFNGGNVETLVTGLDAPMGIALGISPQTLPPTSGGQAPDLVLEAVQVEPATVAAGQAFKLYGTLKNQGTDTSAATTVRYYRSTDNVISTEDTQLGRANRNPLAPNATIRRYLTVTAPTTPGTYYYGICVDSVTTESNTTNNCSAAVSITVPGTPVVSTPSQSFIYWTDGYGDVQRIQRANLDGSNVQDLVTQGLDYPIGIALDVAGSKMYWIDFGTQKIQRANLDGSNVQDLVTQGLDFPFGIALDVAGGKMYWTDVGTVKIQRANLDGSNVQDLVTRGLEDPAGIALDVAGGKMYWTDNGTNKIQRANLDGSNVQDLVTRGLLNPVGIALDVAGGKMYWTDNGTDKIQRANLDGSNVQDLVTQGLENPNIIALDVAGGKMYWTDVGELGSGAQFGKEKIQRANLDGSNVQTLITRAQGLEGPKGIALSIPASAPPIAREDANRDGVVDAQDIVYIGQRYGQTGQSRADVNGDGVVNIDDLILVAAVIDSAPAAPSIRSQLPKDLTAATVEGWLTEAKLRNNKTPTYQRGILTLEQLLAVLTPEETVLLANYPNPFNPETWIPYHLARSADVTLTIYGIDGHVIRQLVLGHQPAGVYQNRSRAAYWDGKNAFGEPVASGVYFYTLTAGEFAATRRMLIRK